MSLAHTLTALDLLSGSVIDKASLAEALEQSEIDEVALETLHGEAGQTLFIRLLIAGYGGKSSGGSMPTFGIIGRLGGIGARPQKIDFVSDADGAIASIAAALKLAAMKQKGDQLACDVLITTQLCTDAPTTPHYPADFMGSPLSMAETNRHEVLPEMDVIFSVDTTRGNEILNHKGIAISYPVKSEIILAPTSELLNLYKEVTGISPKILPLASQDITPYENGLPHINSILQPACATSAAVVGVALTAESIVPGSATGVTDEYDLVLAARFCVEGAKRFSQGNLPLYDEEVYQVMLAQKNLSKSV